MEAVIPFEEFPETACADEWSASLRSNWLLGASGTKLLILRSAC